MSVINKMLKDLDRRNASPEGMLADGEDAPAAAELRPVGRQRGPSHAVFWWLMSGLMLIAIAWLAWVMWQLMPRPVVNEVALRRAPRVVEENRRIVPALPAFEQAGPVPSGGASLQTFAGPDMLRLATEITTPIRMRPAARSEAASPVAKPPELPVTPAPQQPVRNVVQPLTPPAGSPIGERTSAPGSSAERIVKRPTPATRDQAEAEYRRAATLISQGRVHEGMDGLRTVLNLDPGHETARQGLVSLALEQRRMEEAAGILSQGLELNPGNSGFAILLARILVERKDFTAALDLLKKHAPSAARNPDYHAFAAALLQRLTRHDEAMAEYRLALQMAPQSVPWWVGLGISQEATGRGKDALVSFRRARELGATGELLAYVEQRLKQLE